MDRPTVALSPSRASDFKWCPQLYKYRVIDRLPEPPDPASARGSLVHSVLERLYALPAGERTFERADQLIDEVWGPLRQDPELVGLELPSGDEAGWLGEVRGLLSNAFRLEDPRDVAVHDLESRVEHDAARVLLRGIIDRIDVAPDGEWVLTDYKTGRSPSDAWAFGSFFALRFYALLCWRAFGKMPRALRLVHLREPEVITLYPTQAMLLALERQLEALARAIARARSTGDWRPRPGPGCSWCPHRAICPAMGAPQAEPQPQLALA
ncbi:MAG: RecB family exonuclease [Actinomycetota bacterium]